MTPRTRIQIVQSLALLCVSVVMGLLVGEVFLRLFPQFLTEEARLRLQLTGAAIEARNTIPDPYVGFLFLPFHHGEEKRRDFAFTYTTGEHGFRNLSPWPSQAEIVCVGNSMVFGYGVPDDQAWIHLVAAGLPESRIISLGLPGASPEQYARIYERFGIPLRPQLLIFGLFPGNDLHDALLFDKWLKAGSAGNYNLWRLFRGNNPGPVRGLRSIARRSYLLGVLRESLRTFRSPFSGRTIEFPNGTEMQLVPTHVARMAEGADPSHPEFRLTMEAIERARRLADAEGTEFLVLLFPTKEEVYLPVLGEATPPAIAPFVKEFREREIPYLDLTSHFQTLARKGEPLFFKVDGHPNAKGYHLIADVVLKHLRENANRYGLKDWEYRKG